MLLSYLIGCYSKLHRLFCGEARKKKKDVREAELRKVVFFFFFALLLLNIDKLFCVDSG